MAKMPWFPFYIGDWMKDPALRCVSSATRGLWIDCICLMWESHRQGFLVHASGAPVTVEQLGRMTGNTPADTAAMVAELEACNVCSRTEDGVLYSRRVSRDAQKRAKCSEAGRKGGGNPALQDTTFKGVSKGGDKGAPKGDAKGGSKRASVSDSDSVSPSMSEGHKRGFTPPTVEEVKEFCLERGNQVDAEYFVNYYEARGWKLKGVPMKSWKASVRTWERNTKVDPVGFGNRQPPLAGLMAHAARDTA